MNKGGLLAAGITVATVGLIAIGTIWPIPTAAKYAGLSTGDGSSSTSVATPASAVDALGTQMKLNAWGKAYATLANKAEFTQDEFLHDLTGGPLSLRTYATLDSFDIKPLHQAGNEADVRMDLHWSSVVGTFNDTRDLHVVKVGDHWAVDWPLVHEVRVPPQVIPINYLRWDVIRSGSADDWGAQDVEAPHVRIVDVRTLNRADGVVVMGELLNEDVMPSYVSVRATLVDKKGANLDTEGPLDMITHILLPKQVTPFIIKFPGIDISQVGSLKMQPDSVLVSASADPVVEIENQKFTPPPNASLTGQLTNQSGHTVNIAHVLATFYDKNGQVVWVGGQYIDRALLPQTPVDFTIGLPADLAKQVASQRTVVATYTAGSSM